MALRRKRQEKTLDFKRWEADDPIDRVISEGMRKP
jgi:hypothetical protein